MENKACSSLKWSQDQSEKKKQPKVIFRSFLNICTVKLFFFSFFSKISLFFLQALSRDPADIANVERLELRRRDWASKVHSLVFAVDDVTVGTSAPVEQLAAVAMAGDEHALQENSRMLTSYARTLKGMVDAAVAG